MSRRLSALRASLARQEPVARVVVLRAPDRALVGRWMVIWPDRDPVGTLGVEAPLHEQAVHMAREALRRRRSTTVVLESNTGSPLELFVEVLGYSPTLLIVGAGHIAQPLADMGKRCDFRVVVVDDRPQFTSRERFPTADELIVAPFDEALGHFPFDLDTYVVLVTRGHRHDVDALLHVIQHPVAYVGMIGSRRRIRGVFQLLMAQGKLTDEQAARVHAPIGLDIGAETPAEIAVAVMAEIILVRRGGTGRPLSAVFWERTRRVHTWRGRREEGRRSVQ
ncbi:MAG: XdhC/CoxI family protein [Ardenticatenia bacterium]|nr:XdhC/CoxI family protein [Ardenticatenia bacterium]